MLWASTASREGWRGVHHLGGVSPRPGEIRLLLQSAAGRVPLQNPAWDCTAAAQGTGDQRAGEQPWHWVADAREVPLHRCVAYHLQYNIADGPFWAAATAAPFSKIAGGETSPAPKRLCRFCFDLPADGEGQPEPAEQKKLCTSFRCPGNCTHLPSIILGTAGSVARPNALYTISFMELAWNWFWNRSKRLYQFFPWTCDSVSAFCQIRLFLCSVCVCSHGSVHWDR